MKDLKELLKGLCETKEDLEILDNLYQKVQDFSEDMIEFEDDIEVEYEKDEEIVASEKLPKSFAEITNTVTAIFWDAGGPEAGFSINQSGFSDGDDWLLAEEGEAGKEFKKIANKRPIDAFMAGQNGLFFDYSRELSNGEPALAFVSHEGGGIIAVNSVNNLNYKQILLRLISDNTIDTSYITEVYF